MQPFQKTVYERNEEKENRMISDLMIRHGKTVEQAKELIADSMVGQLYINDKYQVLAREHRTPGIDFPPMVHLSIKRLDKEPIHDWRELQEIKNLIIGRENEAVELYPAESRLVDTANQYHLWVIKDPEIKFPFGFHEGRHIQDSVSAGNIGAKQRDL